MSSQDATGRSLLSRAKVAWLNVQFWMLFALTSILFGLVAFPYWGLSRLVVGRRKTHWLIRRTISNYGAATMKCGWPLVKVRYIDHSPDDKPPFVFVCNHRSASDAFLMACLPFECIQMLNNWPSKIPPIGLIAYLAGYLKPRMVPFDELMRDGSKLLAEGCSIIAFPEGTRSGSRALGQFHGSAFRLAQQTGTKIVPLAVAGNEMIPPRGSSVLHPGVITVSKLPAVTAEEYRDMTPYKLKTLVRSRIGQYLDALPA
jgi:1-acyl-sn-glycerol-3-phosphate acyltransferase